VIIFIIFAPGIQINNLGYINNEYFFMPLGVVLFALLGFSCIPELRREIKGDEKSMKKAIFIGGLMPAFLYILFALTFLGVLGENISEVATLSFGKTVNLLGIFTMLTSYFALSFAAKDIFRYDLRAGKAKTFFWVSLFPFLIYILITFFNIAGFIKVLSIGGVVSGGLTGILILFIVNKAKQSKKLGGGDRKPEYSILINKWLILAIILIFVVGVLSELFL
jgi:hypothetical protein